MTQLDSDSPQQHSQPSSPGAPRRKHRVRSDRNLVALTLRIVRDGRVETREARAEIKAALAEADAHRRAWLKIGLTISVPLIVGVWLYIKNEYIGWRDSVRHDVTLYARESATKAVSDRVDEILDQDISKIRLEVQSRVNDLGERSIQKANEYSDKIIIRYMSTIGSRRGDLSEYDISTLDRTILSDDPRTVLESLFVVKRFYCNEEEWARNDAAAMRLGETILERLRREEANSGASLVGRERVELRNALFNRVAALPCMTGCEYLMSKLRKDDRFAFEDRAKILHFSHPKAVEEYLEDEKIVRCINSDLSDPSNSYQNRIDVINDIWRSSEYYAKTIIDTIFSRSNESTDQLFFAIKYTQACKDDDSIRHNVKELAKLVANDTGRIVFHDNPKCQDVESRSFYVYDPIPESYSVYSDSDGDSGSGQGEGDFTSGDYLEICSVEPPRMIASYVHPSESREFLEFVVDSIVNRIASAKQGSSADELLRFMPLVKFLSDDDYYIDVECNITSESGSAVKPVRLDALEVADIDGQITITYNNYGSFGDAPILNDFDWSTICVRRIR